MGYSCTGHSCSHSGYWEPIQRVNQSTKLHHTSRTTGPWQILGQKMSQSKERRKFQVHTKTYSLRHFPCQAIIFWLLRSKYRLVPQQQLVRVNSSWLKELQSLHSEKLGLKELATSFREEAVSESTEKMHWKLKLTEITLARQIIKKCTKNPTEVSTEHLWMPKSPAGSHTSLREQVFSKLPAGFYTSPSRNVIIPIVM